MLHDLMTKSNFFRRMGATGWWIPRVSCLAISAHLPARGTETEPPRWGGETLVQYFNPYFKSKKLN